MSDNTTPPHADDADLGEPIRELAGLREDPHPRFVKRIRGSIERRLLLSDSMDFSLGAFFATLMDYIGAMMHLVSGTGADTQRPKQGGPNGR